MFESNRAVGLLLILAIATTGCGDSGDGDAADTLQADTGTTDTLPTDTVDTVDTADADADTVSTGTGATDTVSADTSPDVPPAPTCTDGVENGAETGNDCGGTTCPKCAVNMACDGDEDCLSASCDAGVCSAFALRSMAAIQQDVTSTGCTVGVDEVTQPLIRTVGVAMSPVFSASAGTDGVYLGAATSGSESGLLVVWPKTLTVPSITPGAHLAVYGDVKEFYCMTELLASEIRMLGVQEIPAPANPPFPASQSTIIEPYEGRLVRLENLEITETATGYYRVNGWLQIDTTHFMPQVSLPYPRFAAVEGFVTYTFGEYRVDALRLEGADPCVPSPCEDGASCTTDGDAYQCGCAPGFVGDGVTCDACDASCATCTGTAATECASCGDGRTLSGGACLLDDAQTCAENAACLNTCIGGTCTAHGATGQACDPRDSDDCGNTTCVNAVCTVCDYLGWVGEPYLNRASWGTQFGLRGDLPARALQIEMYPPYPAVGDHPLAADTANQNYATCTLCPILVFDHTSTGGDYQYFFATGGLLSITEIDLPGFEVHASITEATFVEVTIADGLVSTPVTGGLQWCVLDTPIDYVPECTSDDACTGETPLCSASSGFCLGVRCTTDAECLAAAPICVPTAADAGVRTCIKPAFQCLNDDANDEHDDDPRRATPLTMGVGAMAKVCGDLDTPSAAEIDWYTFTLDQPTTFDITMNWPGIQNDHDFVVHNADLGVIATGGAGFSNPEHVDFTSLSAGTYFISVVSYTGYTEAWPYVLTLCPAGTTSNLIGGCQ